jgi:hypothetical protein
MGHSFVLPGCKLGMLTRCDQMTRNNNLLLIDENPRHARIKMITEETKCFPSAYSAWFGKSVVLVVALRQYHVPLLCSIVGESVVDVRVHMSPGLEMDVRKELILAVEEHMVPLDSRIN